MEDHKFNLDKCNNIEIPDKIHSVINNSVIRGQRKGKKTIIKYFSSIAVVLVIFILSINMSPVFASSVSKILGLEYLVNLVMFDKGLGKAVENNFVQHINKSAESMDIKFTIKDIIIDNKNMVIAYEIMTSNKNYNDLNISFGNSPIEVTDGQDKNLIGSMQLGTSPDENFKKTGKKQGIISVSLKDVSKIPENGTIKIRQMQDSYYKGIDYKHNVIDGDWTINFSIDTKIASLQPFYYPINKNINIGGLNILLNDCDIYPTCGEIKVDLSNNYDYKFVGFINARLVDDRGIEYKMNGGRGFVNDAERTLICESTYFTQSKTLYFKADGALFIPKKDMYIIVDIKNKKVIDDCGFNMEFMYGQFENRDDKRIYNVSFKIKDKEIFQMSNLIGSYTGGIGYDEITDEKNHKYNNIGMFSSTCYKDSSKGEGYIESGISIYDITTEPEILKLKVQYANKGLMQPISIKIK